MCINIIFFFFSGAFVTPGLACGQNLDPIAAAAAGTLKRHHSDLEGGVSGNGASSPQSGNEGEGDSCEADTTMEEEAKKPRIDTIQETTCDRDK